MPDEITLPDDLIRHLAADYYTYLNGECVERLAHVVNRMAPERWLGIELAYIANQLLAPEGWIAEVERSVPRAGHDGSSRKGGPVDVILRQFRNGVEERVLCLELKLIPTLQRYYAPNWRAVYHDLALPDYPGRIKREADFAVCFLIDRPHHPVEKRRPEDANRWEQSLNEGACFHPIPSDDSMPPLKLIAKSPEITANWEHRVLTAERYETRMRVLWVKADDS